MNFWLFAAVSFLFSLAAVNASEPRRSEVPSSAPTKGGPITSDERVRKFGANVNRALLPRWGEKDFNSLHDVSCIVKVGRDGRVLKFKPKKVSQDETLSNLFGQLIKGVTYDARPLGPLESATLEIELQTYPNIVIRQSSENLINTAGGE
jgi:hypothetical protein